MILAITTRPDLHIEMVEKHLGQKIVVFDPHLSPFEQNVTYRWEDGFAVYVNGERIPTPTWVWYRKPFYPTELAVPENQHDLAVDFVEQHTRLMYGLFGTSHWFPADYWTIMRNNNKLLQMEAARNLGFNIPKTTVTNDAMEAQRFRDRVGDLVFKAVSPQFWKVNEKYKLLYTTFLPREQPLVFKGMSCSPLIFQRAIPKAYDLRVTVVGEEAFVCRIDSSVIDWRSDKQKTYQACETAEAQRCVDLVKRLGLLFGAIDLAVDLDGVEWFLEINPNGQWGFIEDACNLPIAAAIAKMFG